jgi:threonine dehydratase
LTPPDPSAVIAAARRLHGIVNETPIATSRTIDSCIQGRLFLKCENQQRVGAFKFRGAYHAISRLDSAAKAAGVITHSSGNHAQGVALAAQLLGVTAVVVMPQDAPPIKRAATAAYGAQIIPCAAVDREKVCAAEIDAHGYTLIHPYDNDDIIAGQGTAAYELLQKTGPLDFLFTPVGGGGLLSGTALAAAALAPECKVIGVEPETAADGQKSWQTGQVHRLAEVPATAADGLRTRFVGERNLAVMRRYVHDMLTVSESDIFATLHTLWYRLKLLVEPSAAVALAPLYNGRLIPPPGSRIGVILSGGNVDIPQLLSTYGHLFPT